MVPPDKAQRIVEAYLAGATLTGLAKAEKQTRHTITRVITDAGIAIRKGKPRLIDDAVVAAMRAEGMTWKAISAEVGSTPNTLRRNACRTVQAKQAVPVPRWVPRDLVSLYQEHGAQYGEEEAARLARQLKRETA